MPAETSQIEILKAIAEGLAPGQTIADRPDLLAKIDLQAIIAALEQSSKNAAGDAVKTVEATLRERNRNGITVCEADFIVGAMTALQATFEEAPGVWVREIPPIWTISIMANQPILDDCPAPRLTEYRVGKIFGGPFEDLNAAEDFLEGRPGDAEIIETRRSN